MFQIRYLVPVCFFFLTGCANFVPSIPERDPGDRAAEMQDNNLNSFWDKFRPSVAQSKPFEAEEQIHMQSANQIKGGSIQLDTRKISLEVSNMSIRSLITELAGLADYKIIISPSVREQELSVSLTDVHWDDAFNTVLSMGNLQFNLLAKSRIIRVFDAESNEAASQLRASVDETSEIYTKVFRLNYASIDVVSEQLNSIFPSQQQEQLTVVKDERTNSLIIRGLQSHLDLAKSVIEAIDVQTPQILIEALIVEANSGFDQALGTRLGASGTFREGDGSFEGTTPPDADATGLQIATETGSVINLPISGAIAGAGVLVNVDNTTLKLELQAMASEGLTQIVSNPKIYALNNQTAEIFQGEEIPYQQVDENGSPVTEFKEAGLSMKVTPTITRDRKVLLKLEIEKNSANFAAGAGAESNPPIDKRKVVTSLLMETDAVAAIGGIFKSEARQNVSRIPGFLGKLFNSKATSNAESELVIFIMPRVI